MKIQTFIFVHEQQIILDYIKYKKFDGIENLKYVFLGDRDTSLIKDYENVIICRDLPINIEEYPKLTSFSGWYALWKNNLYDGEYLNLFEYDINLSDNFNDVLGNALESNPNIIGYIPLPVNHPCFVREEKYCKKIMESISKVYNYNPYDVILPLNGVCSVTSNHTFKKDVFEKYMNWVEPLIDDFKITHMAGHEAERSISLFYLLNKVNNVKIIGDVLFHFQFDTHKTQGIPGSKFENEYEHLINRKNNIKIVTFSNGRFNESKHKLYSHLDSLGIKSKVALSDENLDNEFKNEYKDILKEHRGFGYWCWKPYIILNELKKLGKDEILCYIDSTDLPENNFFNFLIKHFEENDYLLVNRGYNNGVWTKRDCFFFMGCDEEKYYSSVQLEAGLVCFKNNEKNIKLIEEWLSFCKDRRVVTDDPNVCGLPNLKNFIDHRHDQSILTNLAIKYGLNNYYLNDSFVKYNYNQPR